MSSKTDKKWITFYKDKNGNLKSKKSTSHGTFRAKRKPNSKYVKNGLVK